MLPYFYSLHENVKEYAVNTHIRDDDATVVFMACVMAVSGLANEENQ